LHPLETSVEPGYTIDYINSFSLIVIDDMLGVILRALNSTLGHLVSNNEFGKAVS